MGKRSTNGEPICVLERKKCFIWWSIMAVVWAVIMVNHGCCVGSHFGQSWLLWVQSLWSIMAVVWAVIMVNHGCCVGSHYGQSWLLCGQSFLLCEMCKLFPLNILRRRHFAPGPTVLAAADIKLLKSLRVFVAKCWTLRPVTFTPVKERDFLFSAPVHFGTGPCPSFSTMGTGALCRG